MKRMKDEISSLPSCGLWVCENFWPCRGLPTLRCNVGLHIMEEVSLYEVIHNR